MVYLKNYLMSFALSFVITLVGIGVTSCIFAYTNIADIHLQSFVFGVILLSVLIGATVLSKNLRQKGLIMGGLFGLMYCLVIFLSSAIAYTGFFFSNTLLIYLFISVLAGVIGGVIGVNI